MRITCIDKSGEGTFTIILNKKELVFFKEMQKWDVSIPKLMKSNFCLADIPEPNKTMGTFRKKAEAALVL